MLSDLRTALLTQSSITNLVGQRIYVETIPQGAAYPCLLLTLMRTDFRNALDGPGSVRSVEVDIDAKAVTLAAADAIAAAVYAYIKNFTGTMGTVICRAVDVQDQVHGFEPPTDGRDVGLHLSTLDVQIQYTP